MTIAVPTSPQSRAVNACSFAEEENQTGVSSSTRIVESGFWAGGPGKRKSLTVERSQSIRPLRKLALISKAMQQVNDVLERLARTDVTVTLIGQTGTGKDVLARSLHQNSRRANGPFVIFDCGSVAANLAESELLGHERGAFTGAHSTHTGAFERATGGTLFLDEIGELPLELQPRLLRVLESRSVRRVGGMVDRMVNVRVVAATNRDLQAEVAAGRFRQDLYFRLAAAVVQVPTLRERSEDIPLLVSRLLEDLGHSEVEISEETIEVLKARAWPGNVRELKNALACAIAFLDTDVLEPRHLCSLASEEREAPLSQNNLGGQTLETIERAAILQTLEQTRGNKAQAAQSLGIAVSTLYEKLKKYKLTGT
jgi:two-component system, NtrC family, response regulator GlrR